ncbi:PREDICTED: succinate dehydrogenase assembly factor 4, mitochondrial-like [Vollenhovia emeryi]|uniref:succinate dehydrogenase assembly factor 4, mitochondrial-like n=1 Tax=Vollenhovia emeryi TaxID=411798 RepID=UPI0005F39C33|nr:PREDICTED: succinate dehydrogenase assembly factor 4, mitochondrial-like [Vollenhovia emeryi]XP_011871355.1 PREDICTED: succinate dehydrogenase assembly factor 4, mitochondrial-like [Vollenhovia emeryi]XP_011871356.1 PREDICTED: succinate dehydrogenase assembly factor 4, mitochondrial-like [Vollenhovia emeryi]XP_011871357.1 PREDICTED: succinate dehydrogenase assembly factor 4, mitochondrial-like [Vollenhovia emeryi]
MAGINRASASTGGRHLLLRLHGPASLFSSKSTNEVGESPRLREFRKKLRERTPIEKLDELEEGRHPYQEKEPLEPFPNNTNPDTGEVGGPRGPEPTRYGDWERKGRVSDF